MSASRRHNSGEDNILARLERDGKRGAAGKSWRQKNSTLAWCGLASLAVVGLIAVLFSLARENAAAHRKPLVVEARVPSDRYADPDGKSGFAPLPALPSPPRKSVVMVEEPLVRAMPRPVPAPAVAPAVASTVAPMVMLKPAPAPARPVKPVAAPVKHAAARSPAPRPVAKSPPARTAPVKVAAAPAPRVLAATPARAKKVVAPGAAAKPEPAAVDSDVALLSAIILHASRHSAERAQLESAACPSGKKCPAPKATD